ncbi:TlpA family protein disulfide reductase [Aestuariimicrobium sp. T2.26MG-19.2B]|uniref:TlpA family protein disulfide reductase n=1 Tax=Aestuariimicrobium sp. T2.26MG-19.2B TaxID=3040679 RepID=UPI0024777210|nr:TlpA disulfide reductase family protein [Aestuariimicrobium sp. T2.26MG-19.2B]CAI9404727.1 Thiol-disulfide oxidoreductase ResA [Aestuariimicrobium sp. T2.26MG-19.2B]
MSHRRPRSAGMHWFAIGLGVVMTLAACSSAPRTVDELPTPSAVADGTNLQAERKAAGIADCPVTASDAAPVEGGLPSLTLPCLGGGSQTTLAGLRGPMLVNFWAQWCGPCREEAPLLAKASQTFAGKVAFVGVDTNDPRPGLAIEFAKHAGWTYPQLRDATGDQVDKPPLQAKNLPTTILVDRRGRIIARHPGGFTSQAALDQWIASTLGVTP